MVDLRSLFGKGVTPSEDVETIHTEIETIRAERDILQRERDGYKNAYEVVSTELSHLKANSAPAETGTPIPLSDSEIYTEIFSYDGLQTDPKIIHNHDFMRDPAYIAAFRAGENALGLDHKMYWRLHVALWCASHAIKLPGDFVECGVWRGFLSTAIITYLDWSKHTQNFYLFDTFDGMVPETLSDDEKSNTTKLEHLDRYYRGNYDHVVEHFAKFPRINIVKGPVPDTLPSAKIDAVSFLSLDMNYAGPEIAAAEFFWPKMPNGALILLDDYGFVSYEEQKQAHDQFAKRNGVAVLSLPTGQGLIIKS